MLLSHSVYQITFASSGILFLICTCLLFSNVCSTNSWKFLYVSDQLVMCERNPSFSWLPFTLVATAGFQIGNMLYLWHQHNHCQHHLSGTIHALAFNFILSFSSVVEFNTGVHNVRSATRWWILADVTENTLHQISAVQAIFDFLLIHVVFFIAVSIDKYKYHPLNNSPIACYGCLDLLYAASAIAFIVLWLLQLTRPATILEWLVLFTAIVLQVVACERFNLSVKHTPLPDRPIYSRLVVVFVCAYSLFSLIAVLLMAPPGTRNYVRADIGPVMHTGIAFGVINTLSFAGLCYSMRQYFRTQDADE